MLVTILELIATGKTHGVVGSVLRVRFEIAADGDDAGVAQNGEVVRPH